jgi:hypothetical protein
MTGTKTARTAPDGARSAQETPGAPGTGEEMPEGTQALSVSSARDRTDEVNGARREAIEQVAALATRLDVCYFDHGDGAWHSFAWLITEGDGLE